MRKIIFLLMCVFCVVMSGCNSIGDGVPEHFKTAFESPECVDIEGDWRIEMSFGSENLCEIVLDKNLYSRLSVRKGKKLGIYLVDGIQPMVAPVLRIKFAKPFKELMLDGNLSCNINGGKFVTPLEIEICGRAVCFFEQSTAEKVAAEITDRGKLSFKGNIKELYAELDKRAVLEADEVGTFYLEGRDNSICRIKSCEKAEVELEDDAFADFKKVKEINHSLEDNADVKCPVVIPASLKK